MADLLKDPSFYFIISFCFIIVSFALIQRARIKSKVKNINDDLEDAIKLLDTNENHRKYFAENFDEINDRLIKNKSLSHSWHEFKEHLVSPTVKDSELVYRNSIRPDAFFSEDIITSQQIDLRWVYSIPGKITALGILGTFLGLSYGVFIAAKGIQESKTNPSALNDSISHLLDGAALAFISSAVAVLVSLAFSYFEKRSINQVEMKIGKLCDSLDKSLMFTTNVQIQKEQLRVQTEQLKTLDSFSNDIAIALGNMLEEKFSGTISRGFGDVVSILGSLKETQEKLGEGISQEIAKQVTGGVGSQVEDQMNNLAGSLQGMQKLMSEQMNQMIQSQNNLQLETKRMVDEISESMRDNQSNINTEVLMTMKNFQENFGRFSDDMSNNMSKAVEELTSKVTSMNSKVAEEQDRMSENLKEASEKSKELMVEGIGSTIAEIRSTIENLNSQILDSSNQTIRGVEKVFDHLSQSMQQFDNNIVTFNKSIEVQKEVSQLSKDSIISFEGIMSQNRTIGDKFESAAVKMSQFSNNIAAFNSSIGGYTHNLDQAVVGIKNASESNKESWSNYSQRFEAIDESLVKMFEQLDQGTRAYGKQVHDHMSELTSKSENVVSLFGSAVEELSDAIGDLADVKVKKAS